MIGRTSDPLSGNIVTDPDITFPFGERPADVFAIIDPGSGYTVGDILLISAEDTFVANTHGDKSTFRMFRQITAGGNQEEIYNGPPFNNTGSANGSAFQAGDGTGVEVDLFTGTIVIV